MAVWAPDATAVEFCCFDEQNQESRIRLPYCEGGIWYAYIFGITAGCRYGLRADGPYEPASGYRFNPQKLLLDPYARAVEARYAGTP